MFKMRFPLFLLFLFLFSPIGFTAESQTQARGYDDLLLALRTEQSSPQDRVAASWKMGKLMEDDASAHKLWAGYREEINKRLAADLGVRENDIRDMRQFVRVYPELPTPELGWAHYVILIYVHPAEKRKALQEQALREHWPKETLRLEVNRLNEAEKEIPKPEMGFPKVPGKLNTYRVVKAQDGVNAGRLVLDLGFGIQKLLDENTPLTEGDAVSCKMPDAGSRETQKSELDSCILNPESSSSDFYTYSARVTEIKDGDTFEASVDLGFGLSVNQTFRLAGVDAPEILPHGMSESRRQALGSPETSVNTGEGVTAKTFVYHEITHAEGRVVLRAGPPDKYNRILADVWVGGESLNQKLIDHHQAVAVQD